MKYIFEQVSGRSGVVDPFDGVCLSRKDRERANAYMRKADAVTDIVMPVVAIMSASVARIECGIARLTRRIRTRLATPARD